MLNNKSINLHPLVKSLMHWCILMPLIFSALSSEAQVTCVGVIDSTKTEMCIGNGAITFSNAVASGEKIEWLTSGDGKFNDRFAQKPTYTPGTLDSINGYVFIYLDVYKDDTVNFCSVLPVMTLHIGSMNTVANPASQTICSNVGISNIFFSSSLSTTTYTWTRDNYPLIGGTMPASGTANNITPIKGTLVNNTAAPVLVTFTATPSTATCQGTPITATVLVNPKATATPTPAVQTICSGSNITPISFTSQASNTTYNWTRNKTDSITGIAASGTGNISGVLTNNNTVPVTVTFTIIPTANGCNGSPYTATVTVNPSATVITSTPALQTVCSGTAITSIVSSGGIAGTTYSWTRNNAQITGISSSGTGNISGTLTNTTSAPVYVTFTITPSTSTCANRAAVLVNPRPVAVATPVSQTVCSGSSINSVLLTSAVSGTNFSWTRNNTGTVTGIASSGTGNIAGTLVNTTLSPVTVTFTITPTANGCTGTPITATITVNPRPAAVISGNYTVCTGQPSPNININLTGTGPWNFTYTEGSSPVSVNNYAASTFSFAAPVRSCTYTITSLNDSYCAAISSDLTGSAVITVPTYLITAATGANGLISPSDSSVNCGSNVTYSITPNAGYSVQNVLIDGISVGAISSYTFTSVTAPHSISASFAGTSSTFNISANAGANGQITPAGNTNVTSGGSQTYVITANSCYQIADVLVDGVSVGAVSSYTFTNVTASHTISASFAQLNYIITANAGSNGTITPAGSSNISCGASQTYNITPAACYQIADVLVDGVSVGAVPSYTFANVTAPHTISATFTLLSYTITSSTDANGSITPLGATAVNCGGLQTYTFAPNSGYAIQNVIVDGVSQGAVSSYTFNSVVAPHTISVSFTAVISCTVPTISTTITNVLCKGSSTGAVSVSTTGGTAPFTYSWTGPNGFVSASQNISGVPAGSYTLTLTATGGCSTNRTVSVTEPATALVISATAGTIACAGGTTTLTVTASGGTGTRQYSLNGGAYQTGTTFTVNAAGSPYVVTVRDANSCTTNSNTVIVPNGTSTIPAQPTEVTGPIYNLCGGGTFTYTVTPVPGATTYTWTAPSQSNVSSGQGTNQIQLKVNPSFNSGTVAITPKNACGSGTQYRFTIYAIMYYPNSSVITGTSTVTSGQANVQFSLPFTAGITYNWSVPSGASVTSGQGTNSILIKFGSNGGNVGVSMTNSCGTSPALLKAVSIAAARTSTATKDVINTAATISDLNVYPNPTQNFVTVAFGSGKAGEKFEVVVSNALGQVMLSKSGVSLAGNNRLQIDLVKYTGGFYMVKLITKDQIQTQRLLLEK